MDRRREEHGENVLHAVAFVAGCSSDRGDPGNILVVRDGVERARHSWRDGVSIGECRATLGHSEERSRVE